MTTASPARYQPIAPTAAVSRVEISQGTAIEQSRAVAEVQAAVLVAQQRPRNKAVAVEEMRDATAQLSVASKAYFRYNRGGDGNVTGVSVHLARELARCWGNIDYGLKELHRDDAKGESEMLAHAWDMQTNARASTTFIVPHVRDTRKGAKKLTETRDIYENNANAGARRLREQILAVLPNWFVEEAKANCDATLENGGGKPLAQRIADAIRLFDALGVHVSRVEAKLGRSSGDWSGQDVGQLGTIYSSIKRGETTVEDEFDDAAETGITAEDIVKAGRTRRAPAAVSDPSTKPDNAEVAAPDADLQREADQPEGEQEAAPAAAPRETPPTDQQIKELKAALVREGLKTARQQVEYLRTQFKRPTLGALFDLSGEECSKLTHFLMTAPPDADTAEQLAVDTKGVNQ